MAYILYFQNGREQLSEGKGTSLDTTGIVGEMKEEGRVNKDDYKRGAASKNGRE